MNYIVKQLKLKKHFKVKFKLKKKNFENKLLGEVNNCFTT